MFKDIENNDHLNEVASRSSFEDKCAVEMAFLQAVAQAEAD